MAIDRADWHSGGDFPSELSPEQGGTHIGMFLAWIILHGLQGEFHDEESVEELDALRRRQITGCQFLFKACDGKFWHEDLNEEGLAFAASYYSGPDGNGYGQYLEDYEQLVAAELPTLYHVEDSWSNYDRLEPLIDSRYADWKAKNSS